MENISRDNDYSSLYKSVMFGRLVLPARTIVGNVTKQRAEN